MDVNLLEPGNITLYISLIGFISISILSITNVYIDSSRYRSWSRNLNLISTSILLISFAIFSYYCISANPDIFYSYAYGDPNYPWYYAVSTIWAGETGSIFFWLALIGISIIIFELKQIKNFNQKTKSYIRFTGSLIILGFLAILLIENPFQTTNEMLPEIYNGAPIEEIKQAVPQGFAMSPILLNPWMAIHPPIIFIGYALFTIPLLITLSYGFTDTNKWNKNMVPWSRLGWIFLTLGIAIGAYWAYLTLGWGGYWAWDPVESASLLPWLTATALLHMLAVNKKRDTYKKLSHFTTITTFVLIIFTTFVTRGGLPIEGPHTWGEAVGAIQIILLLMMILPLIVGAYIINQQNKKQSKN